MGKFASQLLPRTAAIAVLLATGTALAQEMPAQPNIGKAQPAASYAQPTANRAQQASHTQPAVSHAQPAVSQADKIELVIGDGYEIKVGPGPTTHNVGGDLLKTTDDWLVIGVRKVIARSTRVPWIGDVPYVGRLFQSNSQHEEAAIYWIPRANVSIQSRIKATSKEHLAAYKIGDLKLDDCTQILAAPEGKEQHFMPTSDISTSDGLLHFKHSKNNVVQMRHIPLAEVFFATQPLPVEQPAAKTAIARRVKR